MAGSKRLVSVRSNGVGNRQTQRCNSLDIALVQARSLRSSFKVQTVAALKPDSNPRSAPFWRRGSGKDGRAKKFSLWFSVLFEKHALSPSASLRINSAEGGG